MAERKIRMAKPLVIRTGEDFDKLGVGDSKGIPFTAKRLLTMDRGAVQDLLICISGVIGIHYEEPFLNEVLPGPDSA